MASSHETKCFRLYFDNDKDMKVRDILNSVKGQSVGDYIKTAILSYTDNNISGDTQLLCDTLSQINRNTHVLYDKLCNLQLASPAVFPNTGSQEAAGDIIPMSHDTNQEIDMGAMNDFMEFMNV